MSKFKPGDKVQLLNENLKGIITGQAGDRKWLVETDDGFEIPFDESELVAAEGQEERDLEETERLDTLSKTSEQGKEVLLVFRKGEKENELPLYLVNQMPCTLLFTLHFNRENSFTGFAKGVLDANSQLRLGLLNMENFDQWSNMRLHGLIYAPKPASGLPMHFEYSLSLNARKFMKSLSMENPFNEEAHVFQVFDPGKKEEASPATKEEPKPRLAFTLESPPDVVDLHIERLVDNHKELAPAEMLQRQMAYFEACLEKAIALNYEKITFIHGAGQGILKNKIRSALVKVKEVKRIRDANPELYGGGATEVILG